MLKSLNYPIVDIHWNRCIQHLIINCKMAAWVGSYAIYSTEVIRLEAADSCDRSGTIVAVTSWCHWKYRCTDVRSILGEYTYKFVCTHLWWAVQRTPAYTNSCKLCKLCKYIYIETGGILSLFPHLWRAPPEFAWCSWREKHFAFMVLHISLKKHFIYNVESDVWIRNKQSCTPASYSMQSSVSHIHTIYLPVLHVMCIC